MIEIAPGPPKRGAGTKQCVPGVRAHAHRRMHTRNQGDHARAGGDSAVFPAIMTPSAAARPRRHSIALDECEVPGTILEITRPGDLQPFMLDGVPVLQNFRELRSDLRMALSEQHAQLFAEPASGVSGNIRWYAPMAGTGVRLRELPPAARAAAEAR